MRGPRILRILRISFLNDGMTGNEMMEGGMRSNRGGAEVAERDAEFCFVPAAMGYRRS